MDYTIRPFGHPSAPHGCAKDWQTIEVIRNVILNLRKFLKTLISFHPLGSDPKLPSSGVCVYGGGC